MAHKYCEPHVKMVIAHPPFQGRSLVGGAGDFDKRRRG
jgi:hypothetical protein